MRLLPKICLTLIIACISTILAKAQDTIYIYEEVIVYDTVYEYVEKRINPFEDTKALHIIQVDTLTNTSKLLIISNGQSTSIPIDKVVISEDVKKHDSTSNLRFLDLMSFAVKNMLVDKSTLDMFIGFGAWTSICTPLIVEKHFSWNSGGNGTICFGLSYNTDFISRFTLGTGASIHFLGENDGLKAKFTCEYPDCGFCELNKSNGLYMKWDDGRDSVGFNESTTNYVLLAIPLTVGYRIGKFNPYAGIEYNIRMAMENAVDDLHSLGIITGMRYDFNRRFAFTANFYSSLTKDMTHTGTLYRSDNDEIVRTDKYSWRSFRFEITAHFKF